MAQRPPEGGQTTADATSRWAHRHEDYPPGEWVQRYWNATEQPHRLRVVQAIAEAAAQDHYSVRSILEIGCNAGPNLRLLREAFPRAVLTGIDVNAEAVLYAREQFRDDVMVRVEQGDMRREVDRAMDHDVVMTCYSLAYIDPDDLPVLLRQVLMLARRLLVIAEPMPAHNQPKGIIPHLPYPEWRHNYVDELRALGVPPRRIHKSPIDPPVDRLNAILTARP